MSQQYQSTALRFGVLTASAVAVALVLTGCAGSAAPDPSAGEPQEFTLTVGKSDNITENPYDILAQQYMDANPNVTITVNKLPSDTYAQILPTQLQAGNAGDVFVTSAGQGDAIGVVSLAVAGFLAPLGESAASVIPAGSEDAFQIDGETYGQALSMSFFGTIFNETAAKAAGIEYPTDWDSVEAACKAAAADGQSLFVVAGSIPPNTGLMAQVISSSRVYAENPEWNEDRAAGKTTFADSDEWKDTLETIVDMNDAGCFQGGAAGAGFDALAGGVISGSSLSAFIPGDAANQFGAASDGAATFTVHPFPGQKESDKAFGIVEPAYSLSIAQNSENIPAAQAFLDWLAEPEQTKTFADIQGNLPVSGLADVDLSGTVYEPIQDIIANGEYTAQPLATWPNPGVYDALGTGVQGLLTGQKTVDQVLADMDTAWDN